MISMNSFYCEQTYKFLRSLFFLENKTKKNLAGLGVIQSGTDKIKN